MPRPSIVYCCLTLARFRRVVDNSDEISERVLGSLMRAIHGIYGPALRWGLARPRATLAAALGVFVLSLALVPMIGFSLFPTADIPQFRVRIEAPDGYLVLLFVALLIAGFVCVTVPMARRAAPARAAT